MNKHESVEFKGNKDGVHIVLDATVEIPDLLNTLRDKLKVSGKFFRGAVVTIDPGERDLKTGDEAAIRTLVEEFGIAVHSFGPSQGGEVGNEVGSSVPGDEKVEEDPFFQSNALLVKRTLRSGQRIEHNGNVVVLGDVNPGAMIRCGGDIIVLGALRGMAHAGIYGDEETMVFAFRLEPTQLRIGHLISRPPDNDVPNPDQPEIARARNGVIQIEAYKR